jgi:hypothetical protein
MRSFLIIAIMAAFALPCAAQMSAQRAKVTEIRFLKYRTSTTVAKDSAEIHTNAELIPRAGSALRTHSQHKAHTSTSTAMQLRRA